MSSHYPDLFDNIPTAPAEQLNELVQSIKAASFEEARAIVFDYGMDIANEAVQRARKQLIGQLLVEIEAE